MQGNAAVQGRSLTALSYQDDTHIVGRTSLLAEQWPDINAHLEQGGHEVVQKKSGLWWPAADQHDDAQLPESAKRLAEQLPRKRGGLDILGTSATARLSCNACISAEGLTTKAAEKRLADLQEATKKIAAFAESQVDEATRHMAWSLLAKTAARSHDFDAKLLAPCKARGLLAAAVVEVKKAAQSVLSVPWSYKAEQIARLPGALGGCGLRLLDAPGMAEATYWATWVQTRRRVQELAEKAGRPISEVQGRAEAEEAWQCLHDLGVETKEEGAVALSAEKAEVWEKTWWARDRSAADLVQDHAFYAEPAAPAEGPKPPRRLLGKLWRALEATRAMDLWATLDKDERELHYDAGGAGAGSTWCAAQHLTTGANGEVWFSDPHFQLATATRLLAVDPPLGTTCNLAARSRQHAKGDDDEERDEGGHGQQRWERRTARCGEPIGRHAGHAYLCKAGPARMRPHRALQRTLANCVVAADGYADLEREEPSLARYNEEKDEWQQGKVDIWATFPGVPRAFLLDVTIRCCLADRYAGGNHLAAAASEKETRYGRSVACLAFGTMGRASPEAQGTVYRMAEAAAHAKHRPDQVKAMHMTWLQCLQRAVIWSETDIALLALGRWRR